MNEINVFISYAKDDAEIVKSLITLLRKSPYFQQNGIKHKYKFWSDQDMIEGNDWKQQIVYHIKECDVFICMLTEGYLVSEFIRNTELPLGLQRQEEAGIVILGILLAECDYNSLEIKRFELTPKKYERLHPYSSWKSQKEAVSYIRSALKSSAISSMLNLSSPLRENRLLLTPSARTKHDKQFLSQKKIKRNKQIVKLNRKVEEEGRKAQSELSSQEQNRIDDYCLFSCSLPPFL